MNRGKGNMATGTPTMQQLQGLADEVNKAQVELDQASALLSKDNQNRRDSLLARLYDWLCRTPAEDFFEVRKAALEKVKAQGQQAAKAWIIETAAAELKSSPETFARHAAQSKRVADVTARAKTVGNLLGLAEAAEQKLAEAQSSCESASTVEMVDMFTTNKAVSIISSLETGSAADDLKSAQHALKKLADALPKRAKSGKFDIPDDFLDLVVDFAFAPTFDFLSFFNMSELDGAADQCQAAIKTLQPLLDHLREVSEKVKSAVFMETGVLQAIEADFVQEAAVRVPVPIQIPAPAVPLPL